LIKIGLQEKFCWKPNKSTRFSCILRIHWKKIQRRNGQSENVRTLLLFKYWKMANQLLLACSSKEAAFFYDCKSAHRRTVNRHWTRNAKVVAWQACSSRNRNTLCELKAFSSRSWEQIWLKKSCHQ